jgi:hypothetical protein
MKWRVWVSPVLAAVGVTWCVVMGCWLWFTPMRYVGIAADSGQAVTLYRSFSEVSQFGPLPLIIPASLAMVAAWAAWRGYRVGLGVSTFLLVGFTIIAGFSIGNNYIPAAGALVLSTLFSVLLGSGNANRKLPADGR